MDIVERMFAKASKVFADDKSFASAIGVKPQRISEWRLRKSSSYVKRLEIISGALNTSPQWLLTGEGDQDGMTAAREGSALPPADEQLLRKYHALSDEARGKLLGYLDALSS